jgi:hypothetical protein
MQSNKTPKTKGKSTSRKPSSRNTKEIEGGPIDPANIKATIINLQGKEASIAGYIGFENATQLRSLVCTWPVLQIWPIWHKEIGTSYKRHQFGFISRHLHDLEAVVDPHETWPYREDDDNEHKMFKFRMRMGWCLVQLKLALDDYASFSDEDNRYMSSLQWDKVEDETEIKFPRDEPLTYPVPVMGPLKGESPMEPFGRAWEILKYFSSVQGSIWSTRFATVGCMRKAPIVTESNLPKWMKPDTEEVDEGAVQNSAHISEFSHKIKVKLSWDASVRFRGLQALKNALEKAEEDDIWIPDFSLIMSHDPRVCTSTRMFRDLIRGSLNCQKLGLDLRQVDITYTAAGAEEGRLFHMNPWQTEWTEMKANFNDPDNTNFLVDVKLCARSEDQMDYSILESDEVLPGLIPPILTDSIPGTPDPSPAISSNKGNDEENDKEDKGLEASLLLMKKTSNDSNTQARPKALTTKDEQMAYYDGNDVETEKGRMQWQIATIGNMLSVVGPVSRKDGVDENQFISPEAAKNLHQAH